MRNYLISEQLMNAIAQLLNSMPALQSRGVLNALEALVQHQNAEQAAGQKQAHGVLGGQAANQAMAGKSRNPLRGNDVGQPSPQGGGGPGEER